MGSRPNWLQCAGSVTHVGSPGAPWRTIWPRVTSLVLGPLMMWPNQFVQRVAAPRAADGRDQRLRASIIRYINQVFCFVENGLVEPGSCAARLIDDEGWNTITNRVIRPAFVSAGCSLNTRASIAGPMNHDQRPACGHHGNLELHIHLADDQLLC